MPSDILPPTDDWVFKLIFGDERHKQLTTDMVQAYLELSEEECKEVTFMDTYLKPETEEEKMGILDVKLKTKTGKTIDVEIQVNRFKFLGKRISFYKSKLIVVQIGKGRWYKDIEQVICLFIVDYELFQGVNDYVNRFQFFNPKNGLCFEEIPEMICTVEIPKVPKVSDGTNGWNWTQFFKARRKEEFEMAASRRLEIRQAVDLLYELSADEEVRAEYDRRQKAWMDHQSIFHSLIEDSFLDGFKKGEVEGEAKGEAKGEARGEAKGEVKGIEKALDLWRQGKTPEEAMKILGIGTT